MMTGAGTARRRGVIFVAALILLAGMSVVVIALVSEVTLDMKMAVNLSQNDEATEIARAGVDNIIYLANTNPAWRTTYTSGPWITNKALGGGAFTAWGIDPDGDLANCPIDNVTATATATYKGAVRTVTATLQPPVHDSMMYLAYAVGGPQDIRIKTTCRIYGDLCAADQIQLDGGSPDARGKLYVGAAGKAQPQLIDADSPVVIYSTAPALPNVDFNWFIGRGSQISPPVVGGVYQITDKVISTTSNPYGFTNANGIYYITGDQDLKFTRCYITATIVVKTTKRVIFENAAVHAPANASYPTLLSDKEVVYQFDQYLSESASNVDFNGDGDKTDTFTPSVSGVVYAKVKITALQDTGGTNTVRFKGALVSNEVVLTGTGCIFEQDPNLATNPVCQFQGLGLRLVRGTYKWQ